MASSTPPLYTYALLASLKGGSSMRHSPHSLSSPTPDTKGTPQSVHRGLEMRCLENPEEQSRHRGACPADTSSSPVRRALHGYLPSVFLYDLQSFEKHKAPPLR